MIKKSLKAQMRFAVDILVFWTGIKTVEFQGEIFAAIKTATAFGA